MVYPLIDTYDNIIELVMVGLWYVMVIYMLSKGSEHLFSCFIPVYQHSLGQTLCVFFGGWCDRERACDI